MLAPGNTSPCHRLLHLFAQTVESHVTGIAQQLPDQALRLTAPFLGVVGNELIVVSDDRHTMTVAGSRAGSRQPTDTLWIGRVGHKCRIDDYRTLRIEPTIAG